MSCDPVALEAELNEAENAMGRAMRAARKSNYAKVKIDAEAGIAHAQAALAMCHEEPHEPPVPAPAQWVRADSIVPIPSDFDIDAWLGHHGRVAPAQTVDGSFRLTGNMSHLSHDDPIVYPGQPGKAHLHHFFGNRTTDAFSTYESLRANPHSTTDADMTNGSAYWLPAFLNGDGFVKVPQFISIYYKRRAQHDPLPYKDRDGKPRTTILSGLPAGLRMVFGSNFAADPRPDDMAKTVSMNHTLFYLRRGDLLIKQAVTLVDILPLAQAGDTITFEVRGPDLWDGVHIDAPDHRSHLAYSYLHKWGWRVAPAGYDYEIPVYSAKAVYKVLPGEDPLKYAFSSDMGAEPGSSGHADLMEAWDPTVRQMWEQNALDKGLNCVAGDLGNGMSTKRWPGFTLDQQPDLVPVPHG